MAHGEELIEGPTIGNFIEFRELLGHFCWSQRPSPSFGSFLSEKCDMLIPQGNPTFGHLWSSFGELCGELCDAFCLAGANV